MSLPLPSLSRRASVSAVFAVVLVVFVAAQWSLLKTTEDILPHAHHRKRRGGVDRSFFLDHHTQEKRFITTQTLMERERKEKEEALKRHGVESEKRVEKKENGVEKSKEKKDERSNKDTKSEQKKEHSKEDENEKKEQPSKSKEAPNKIVKIEDAQKSLPKKDDKLPSPNVKESTAISPSYEEDKLCGGCLTIKMDNLMRGIHREVCGILIYNMAREKDWSYLYTVRHMVHKLNYTDCLPCLKCEQTSRQYWRYDVAAPTLANAKTHYFQSLPPVHRIPTEVLTNPQINLKDYFSNLNQQNIPPKQYLFEYNPSIVPLPDYMTFDKLPDADQIQYIASFRLATQQACFDTDTTLALIGGEWESAQRPQKKDFLGIALMRKDLSVVAEAIIDLPRPFRKREDFRLFVLHGQLFVATYCKITPIWIMMRADAIKFDARLQWDLATPVHSWDCIQAFDSPLRVKIGSDITQCAEEPNDNKHSKNLNFFVNSKQQTIVELFPLAPHTLRHLKHVQDPEAATPTRADDITTEEMPSPSFYTLEELVLANELEFFEVPFTRDRGGACCIEIQHPTTKQPLWLGIAHAKTPHARPKLKDRLASNQYLSRFYAFEAEEPYKIAAVSGLFCLPLPTAAAAGDNNDSNNNNPLVSHSAPDKVWTLGSVTFDCPVIHFVTGMTEKVGDPDTLILAYGVADCTSWFAEVKKADVIQMLFFGPKENGSKVKT